MKKQIFLIITCFVWLVSLLNGTGIGNAYNTNEYGKYIIYAAVMIPVFIQCRHLVKKYFFGVFCGMVVVFVASSLIQGHGLVALDYLTSFMLIAVMSRISVREDAFKLTGYAYGGLGLAFLMAYNVTDLLSGWNTNSISMVALMSYMIFAASNFFTDKKKDKFILVSVTVIYTLLILPLNSRSCMLAMLCMCVLILFGRKSEKFIASSSVVKLFLLLPLLMAVVVVLYYNSPIYISINEWSLNTFGKVFTNGRENIWQKGFNLLFDNFFFGTGEIISGWWHNSAIACLTAYGVVGYILWLLSLYIIISKGRVHANDPLVSGCLAVFLIINLQQGLELGMFAPYPNLLIYLPLGIMLGRIKYIMSNKPKKEIDEIFETDTVL